MRNIIKKVAICIMIICSFMAHSYLESHYIRKDCVIIQTYDNYVIAEDRKGYNWTFAIITDNDVQVGNIVDLKMFTNFTDNSIHDDIVKSYQKKGK